MREFKKGKMPSRDKLPVGYLTVSVSKYHLRFLARELKLVVGDFDGAVLYDILEEDMIGFRFVYLETDVPNAYKLHVEDGYRKITSVKFMRELSLLARCQRLGKHIFPLEKDSSRGFDNFFVVHLK